MTEQDTSKLDVLLVKPGCFPQHIQIDPGLEPMQQAVGGFIEAVYPFEEPVAVVCNEEGKLTGLEPNRALRTEDGEVYDILVGDFLVVGLGEEDFQSLTPEQMKQMEQKFHSPEMFFRTSHGIQAMPIPDKMVEQQGREKPHKPHQEVR